MAHLDRVMECGQAFGCEILCGPTHSAIGVFSGEGPTEDEFKYGVETLQRAAEKAQARGIKIAVEYLNRFEIYFLTTAAQTARFVRAVDHPCLQDDVRQLPRPHRGEGPGARRSPRARPRRSMSTSRRTTAASRAPARSTGTASSAASKQSGYDGYLTIEAFGRALPALAAATKVWRDLFPDPMGLCRDGLAFIKSRG